MTITEQHDLLQLAEHWRAKATRIENVYARKAPSTVAHCVAALETCAEEIESFCRRYPISASAQAQSAAVQPSVEPRLSK